MVLWNKLGMSGGRAEIKTCWDIVSFVWCLLGNRGVPDFIEKTFFYVTLGILCLVVLVVIWDLLLKNAIGGGNKMNRYLKLMIGEFVVGFVVLAMVLSVYPQLFDGGNVVVLFLVLLVISGVNLLLGKFLNRRVN